MIYLDYSANTPVNPMVLERFCQLEQTCMGNPNSNHAAGRETKQKMDTITAGIANTLHIHPEEIIYTSGASEANNLAIKGIAHTGRHIGKHIISTPLEHSSVSGALTALQERGYEIDLLDIRRDGTIDVEHLQELLRKDTVLVAVCAVDSELGTIQPIAEIAEILKSYPDCRLHVDATQAVGKIPVCFDGVDTMSFAPHKFYGLNGSGILYKRKGVILEPLIHGGASTTIYRSGTPALALAGAAELALQLTLEQLPAWRDTVQHWNTLLREQLARYPKVRINSPQHAVPHILNLSVQGVRGTAFQQALDRQGICVSVKSACSVPDTPSRAVFAVSRDRKQALSSWRISLSHLTTQEEIDQFLSAFDTCYKELTA
ncbi:cysteine desulfurase family protein [Butyricicoccus sp.]|uniref:cysteine desulfurase family protein n=1 Tax=Butyricicoccus sp. TaxID=2049021 RepID=UPI003F136B47